MLLRSVSWRLPIFAFAVCWFVSQPICGQAGTSLISDGDAGIVEAEPRFSRVSLSQDGLSIGTQDHAYVVRVNGYLQGDGRLFDTNLNDRAHDVLLFRRIRPLVEGTLARWVDFRLMPDFGEGNAILQEAYVEWNSFSFAKPRIGKFKTPIGLEVLRSDRDLTFSERSLVSDLVPLRDLGAQVESSFLQDAIVFEVGYFSGARNGTNANFEWRGTYDGVARVFVRPFAATNSAAQNLGIGIAASFGHNHGAIPELKTVGQQTFFRYASSVISDGQQRRVSPQAYYFCGRFGVLGEYLESGDDAAVGAEHRYLSDRGWELAGSIALTGERNSYAGIRPARAFEPAKGLQHIGAWEIAFRQSRIDLDTNTFPHYANPRISANGAVETSVGLSWYLNRHTKMMTDYEFTKFRMAEDKIPRLFPERVAMTRVQLTF